MLLTNSGEIGCIFLCNFRNEDAVPRTTLYFLSYCYLGSPVPVLTETCILIRISLILIVQLMNYGMAQDTFALTMNEDYLLSLFTFILIKSTTENVKLIIEDVST